MGDEKDYQEENQKENQEENQEENKEENKEENQDEREEETSDEIRDEDYRENDMIEMLRNLESKIDSFMMRFDSIEDTLSMFVQSGATIREDFDEETRDEFEDDFVSIDELDLSL